MEFDSPSATPASKIAVIYHEMYDGRGFSRLTRSWGRYRAGFDKFRELGLIAADSSGEVFPPTPDPRPLTPATIYQAYEATDAQLATVHSREHIEHIHAMDAKGEGMFDRNDTPAWSGVFRRAALAFGGTLRAAELIAEGQARQVFHVAGGLHHAHYDRVSGFCIFNDIVGAVRLWQQVYGYKRIAILDVDGHHGDGTQSLLYHEPILTVSLHQYDGRFFPRTGALTERGDGPGLGYALNLPLPRFSTDAEYRPALEIALATVEAYQPEAIILQYGVDGHYTDRMVGLKLSTYLYEEIVRRTLALANKLCNGKMLIVGGGGYEPEAVARCWGVLLANLTGQAIALVGRYTALHDNLADLPSPDPAAVAQVGRLLVALEQML